MASRQRKTSPDCFYYYISRQHPSYKIVKGTKYRTECRLYFGMDIVNWDKSWTPHVICGRCRSNLEGWLRDSGRVMSFAVSRVWREPQNYHGNCYFCMINNSNYRKVRGGRARTYLNMPSSIAPVPYSYT